MSKVLIAYSTMDGQTRKIARALQKDLRLNGVESELLDISRSAPKLDLRRYQGVIVGAPVHMSHYPKILHSWVRLHAAQLANLTTAFFSVCLGVLQKSDAKAQATLRTIAENFFVATRWNPGFLAIWPGALPYTKYGWFKRRLLHWIVKRGGVETDMKRDYEYTDWNEIRDFANVFAANLRSRSSHGEIAPVPF